MWKLRGLAFKLDGKKLYVPLSVFGDYYVMQAAKRQTKSYFKASKIFSFNFFISSIIIDIIIGLFLTIARK